MACTLSVIRHLFRSRLELAIFWIPLLSPRTDHASTLVQGAVLGFDGLFCPWPIVVVVFSGFGGSSWKSCGRLMLVVVGLFCVSSESVDAGPHF